MEKLGVITKVEKPTGWRSGIVVVPNPNGSVRICVDLPKLNDSVCQWSRYLHSLEMPKVFTTLDANSGFWQIKLFKESSILITFITPFGRYAFNRLPFGITSAPEHFQRRMSDILAGLEGVVCMIDDVLVHGQTMEEHNERVLAVLERIKQAGITLNFEKCEFSKSCVKFLGQLVDNTSTGVKPDPEKVQAICDMKEPRNVTEVRRMTNQLSIFTPDLASKTKPLWDLLSKKGGSPTTCI